MRKILIAVSLVVSIVLVGMSANASADPACVPSTDPFCVGGSYDAVPPVLTGLSLSPLVVDGSSGNPADRKISLLASGTDDVSGLNGVCAYVRRVTTEPFDTHGFMTICNTGGIVSGTLLNGTMAGDLTLEQYYQLPGQYRIHSVSICDKAARCQSYDRAQLDSLGIDPMLGVNPPSLSCEFAPFGWQPDNISIACTAYDPNSSLVDPSDASFNLTTSVPAGTENSAASTGTKIVCNVAGSCATAGPFSGMKVDRRAPAITSPQNGAEYTQGSSANFDFECVDSGSGVATCTSIATNGSAIDTSSIGVHTFEVFSTDDVGNSSSRTFSYEVVSGTVEGEADVKITKTADPSLGRPGDVITFHLKAENVGTAIAEDVVITDNLPAGLSFVSADAPCVEALATVKCEIGDLGVGESKTFDVKVKVDPWGDADPTAEHLLDVQKVEAQIDLEAGEQKTVTVSCPANYFASDGSVRIDHIDQGTGDWTSPEVLESAASAIDTWQGTVKNTATGRAQAKIFAVCIKRSTNDAGGHSHDLITSDPITVSNEVPVGKNEFTLVCGPGQVAIQPGFQSSTPADLVYSEPEGNGWKFVLDNQAPADVTASIRCMTRQVSFSDGHTHDLRFEHIVKEFTIPAGTVSEAQLTCADGYKGIVADMDLDDGLKSLGNDPRPVTRAFKLYNPTDHDLEARLSLLCLGNMTQGEHLAPVEYTNTAYISTSSDESITFNNHSSANVVAEDTDNNTPIDPEDPVKPTPNNPIATAIAGNSVTFNRRSGAARITATGPTSGVAKLTTTKAIKIKGKKFRKGTLIAKGSYSFNAAGSKIVKLKIAGKRGNKVLTRIRKASLVIPFGARKNVDVIR